MSDIRFHIVYVNVHVVHVSGYVNVNISVYITSYWITM